MSDPGLVLCSLAWLFLLSSLCSGFISLLNSFIKILSLPGKAYTIWVSGLGARGLLHRYGFVCELADDTSADGLPDGALFANWAASVKLKLLEEESPGQVFWASPLDSHCIFLPLSLLDPTSNFWISWLQVNTYPAQRLMACFWVLARRYRTQMVSGDQH